MRSQGSRWRMAIAALCLGSGCGVSAPASRERPPEYVPAEIQPGPGESIISKSTLDRSNRYAAAVLVDGDRGTCSGVLIAPSTVLTAGHCVCAPREAGPEEPLARTFIDKTTCAPTATVKVVTYQPQDGPRIQVFTGGVNPHEQLKILYSADDKEVSSNADLAVIVLKNPPQGVKPIRLATAPIRYTQPVSVVGYGGAEPGVAGGGDRRFGFNEIASVAQDGATFLIGKPIQIRRPYTPKEMLLVREDASYSLNGDSGGPCLRERNGSMELVGIAKTRYGGHELVQFSEYTSTYFHLEWLRREIANAERKDTD